MTSRAVRYGAVGGAIGAFVAALVVAALVDAIDAGSEWLDGALRDGEEWIVGDMAEWDAYGAILSGRVIHTGGGPGGRGALTVMEKNGGCWVVLRDCCRRAA